MKKLLLFGLVFLCLLSSFTYAELLAGHFVTGGTAGTIQFRVVSDAVSPPSTTTASVHLITKAYVTDDSALNEIKKGDVFFVGALPTGANEAYERYLGVQTIVATTTTTEGTVTAFLTLDPAGWKSYADGAN